MIKKIYFYSLHIIIIILILTLILIGSKKNTRNNFNFVQNEVQYVLTKTEINEVKKTLTANTIVELNEDYYKEVLIPIEKEPNIIIKEGQIIFPDQDLLSDYTVKSDLYGKIEKITKDNEFIVILISDFTKFRSEIKVEEKFVDNIEMGKKVSVKINDKCIDGFISMHSYEIIDGYLTVTVDYEYNNIYKGSSALVSFVLEEKNNVLRISKDALFVENDMYYVNIIEDNILIKTKIDIGLIGDEFVEIKSGIMNGKTVVINQYE